jgi:uncharacterized membrane protein
MRIALIGIAVCMVWGVAYAAPLISDEFYVATVVRIAPTKEKDVPPQTAIVVLKSGKERGQKIEIQYGGVLGWGGGKEVREGDTVVVSRQEAMGEVVWYMEDIYRLPVLGFIAAIFIALVIIFGGSRGATSIVGLAFSVLVLGGYLIPQIIGGADPLRASCIAAAIIAVISLYIAHGFSKRTSIALLGTIITLCISLVMAVGIAMIARFSGIGTEEVWFLQLGGFNEINLKGLLLGGIIISVLGVLDDITTSQAAIVDEIIKANPSLSAREVYRRALSVGKEHIASLVNTLVLAYAGVSLPILLLLAMSNTQPLWAFINGEYMAVEIVRTLVGSASLVIAVPITTFLAAYFLKRS